MARKPKKAPAVEPPKELPVRPYDVLFEVLEPFFAELAEALRDQARAALQPLVAHRKYVETRGIDQAAFIQLRLVVEPGGLGSGKVSLDFDVTPSFQGLNAEKWLQKHWDGTTPSNSRHESDRFASMGRAAVGVYEYRSNLNYAAGNHCPTDALRLAELLRQVALMALQLETLTEAWLHEESTAIGRKLLLKLDEVRADQIKRGIQPAEVHTDDG